MTTGRGRPAFYVTMLAAQRKDMPSGRAPGGGRTHDDPDAFRFPGRSHSPRGRHHKASPVILIRIVRRVRSMCPTASSVTDATVPTTSQVPSAMIARPLAVRSEEHTSELQSRGHLVCLLLL